MISPALDRSYPDGRMRFGIYPEHTAGPALVESLDVLQAIVDAIPPGGRYLEMGTWAGSAAAYVADLRPDASIVSVDCFAGPQCGPLLWWVNARPNMRLFVGTTAAFCGLCRPAAFDVALVDADHRQPGVEADLALAESVVSPGGVLLAHDYKPEWPGVKKAVDAFCARTAWRRVAAVASLVVMRRD